MSFKSPIPPTDAYRRRGEKRTARSVPVDGRARQYLHAGQYFVSADPTAVTTILGSCISVCLWEPKLKIGGVNHFVLPHWAGSGRLSPRFGSVAIASLIEGLSSLGCTPKKLKAKIFGGAAVFGVNGHARLGDRNIEVARLLLEEERIPVIGEDVGGRRGRKLVFHTDDGSAWVKRI
jgi:chemotaxis protein CheD